MKDRFYGYLITVSRIWGIWLFRLVAWGIATGYFVLFPARVNNSVRFYGALFPLRSRIYHFYCAWKQFHRFTHVFIDRFLYAENYPMRFTQEGWEYLEDALNRKTGAILLMSHLGTWELAAHQLMKSREQGLAGMQLLLYMGRKQKEQIERRQKTDLENKGIRIVAVDQGTGAAVDAVEGIHFLKNGGFLSLTGDRLWGENQRSTTVNFLGHEARVPEGPFVFALLSHAPLAIFFCHQVGKYAYHSWVLPPITVAAKDRRERQKAIQQAAQFYADALADAVRAHPWEWFHFEPFIGKRIEP